MTEKELINAAIRSNAGAFFESKHCKIYGKDRSAGVITPRQNNLQVKIQRVLAKMEQLGLPQRIMGLKPRQKGSTTRFSEEVYCWLRRRAASAVLIGGQYSQVKEAWGMMQTYQKHDTFAWGNQGAINTKEGAWNHGSKLIGETARDVLASVGGTFQVCHCFEVARWSNEGVANAGDVLANVLKAVPLLPETLVIIESTAEGAFGEFYNRYTRAVDGDEFLAGNVSCEAGQYVRIFAAWFEFEDSATPLTEEQKREVEATLDADKEYEGERELIQTYGVTGDDGVLRLGDTVTECDVWEQLKWRRRMIAEECKRDKNIFDRDYPRSWETAFQRSGSGRFNQGGIAVMRQRAKIVTPSHGVLEASGRERFAFRKTDENEAKITIFEKPTPNFRYILAIDPMTGASQANGAEPDFHGVGVLRAGYWGMNGAWYRPCLAARIPPCRWDIDVLEEVVWMLARYYGGKVATKIVIEMNMDRGLTELLKLRPGVDLYMREVFNKTEFKTTKSYGFLTDQKTRENLIERLATAIRECDTIGDGIDVACSHALSELENFIRKPSGRSEAADGHKDDDVLMLALGLQLIDHAKLYVPERTNPFGQPSETNGSPSRSPSAFS